MRLELILQHRRRWGSSKQPPRVRAHQGFDVHTRSMATRGGAREGFEGFSPNRWNHNVCLGMVLWWMESFLSEWYWVRHEEHFACEEI